ncbi:MAG: ATP-binding protein [Eubacteriales bacterium]|nr:ATP-binding protein [Eubacteriales bacterium]
MAFSDSQYDELMRTYYENQLNNQAIANQRKQEIYSAIPRIEEIDKEIALSSIDAVRAKLKTQVDQVDAVKAQNKSLLAEKNTLLEQHGYPVDYLQPIYTCPICKDTGKTGNGYCSCFKQATISLLYKQSELDHILQTENFEHFDLQYYAKESDGTHPYTPYDNMCNIMNKCKQFIQDFKVNGGNFLFYGETGLGKTFLSHCIAKALLDEHHTVLYQSSIHLFEDVCADVIMKKSQLAKSQQTYRYLYDCELLIIDDLGTEFTNSFVSSELYDILNTRMRSGKSTIISTNLNLQELTDRYSDRITTRIFAEYKVFNFYGSNIRLAKRRQSINNEKSII